MRYLYISIVHTPPFHPRCTPPMLTKTFFCGLPFREPALLFAVADVELSKCSAPLSCSLRWSASKSSGPPKGLADPLPPSIRPMFVGDQIGPLGVAAPLLLAPVRLCSNNFLFCAANRAASALTGRAGNAAELLLTEVWLLR